PLPRYSIPAPRTPPIYHLSLHDALPISLPKMPGLGQEAAIRWALVMQKARAGEKDLIVPDGQRPQYEAAFARFANVFPDVFYVRDRKSTRLNSSHVAISYAVFCLKKKKT